jgi:hypothetical protein
VGMNSSVARMGSSSNGNGALDTARGVEPAPVVSLAACAW